MDNVESQEFVAEVIRVLNDYVGFRPVAVLETDEKLQAYPHERCRPIPVYLRGVGAACGRYEGLIAKTMEILETCEASLLRQAYFQPENLLELAFDPRAYDFDHPVNKRPNYQFGTWDPDLIDNDGNYNRFVIQQVTLDALTRRIEKGEADSSREDLLFESAAALAGTILMSSGVCGSGPSSHDSEVSLGNLLPRIATYRDAFYEQLLVDNANDRRIAEANQLRQPFGGVRQYLNAELAKQRARQIQHVHLARLYARMGYPIASARQAAEVPTPSARIICQIQCDLTVAHHQLDAGDGVEVARRLPAIANLLEVGIQCGAIVDPWNILGFDGNFSLFAALENTVHDHRVDELNSLMDEIFALYARTWCMSAAASDDVTERKVVEGFRKLADWWDRFAADSVSSIEGVSAGLLYDAAELAAKALATWHEAGTKSGDIAFWQPHVADFESPKAYILVLNALIDRRDFVASMGVMMHWLSRADEVALHKGEDLFYAIAIRWLDELYAASAEEPASPKTKDAVDNQSVRKDWQLVKKFFDFLEANAGEYWDVPQFDLATTSPSAEALEEDNDVEGMEGEEPDDDGDHDDQQLYAAAYDEMSYHDSSDDGIDSELLGDGFADGDLELEMEARRLTDRLAFLVASARMWKRVALGLLGSPGNLQGEPSLDRFGDWLDHLLKSRRQMVNLLVAVAGHQVPLPGDSEVLQVEYDRRRLIKDALMERIVIAYMVTTEAAQFLMAAGIRHDDRTVEPELEQISSLIRAALAGDTKAALQHYEAFIEDFDKKSMLYVPVSKGGDAQRAATTRARQRAVRLVLELLPRLGLLKETCELLDRCAVAERERPVGPGAVTEFDQVFRIGYQGMVRCLVNSCSQWDRLGDSATDSDEEMIEYLQHLTEQMMIRWLDHSRSVRLSVLERVTNEKQWQKLVRFIERYGKGLFHQVFFHLGNLRAILHQGVEAWLLEIAERTDEADFPLIEVLPDDRARRAAADHLQLIIEAVIENYPEYRDYNSTTTQSDRGEMLYTLLDMLRLRTTYDRYAWNLLPVGQAHEILVRERNEVAADYWRTEMIHRTGEMADELISQLTRLQADHGMKLNTVADRIGERFIRPLQIDRACALVRPSLAEAADAEASESFAKFEQQVDDLAREPTGVGIDLPAWLEDIEEEVERRGPSAFIATWSMRSVP